MPSYDHVLVVSDPKWYPSGPRRTSMSNTNFLHPLHAAAFLIVDQSGWYTSEELATILRGAGVSCDAKIVNDLFIKFPPLKESIESRHNIFGIYVQKIGKTRKINIRPANERHNWSLNCPSPSTEPLAPLERTVIERTNDFVRDFIENQTRLLERTNTSFNRVPRAQVAAGATKAASSAGSVVEISSISSRPTKSERNIGNGSLASPVIQPRSK